MYVTMKSIERWFDICMQESYYQERLKAFEKLQYEEQIRRYDEYFLIPPNDLEKTEMIEAIEKRKKAERNLTKKDYM